MNFLREFKSIDNKMIFFYKIKSLTETTAWSPVVPPIAGSVESRRGGINHRLLVCVL